MEIVVCKTKRARIRKVKSLILSAGNKIGSVHFRKRSDGSKRKMCYRLHVQKPTYANKPKGEDNGRKERNADNNLLTVLDVNKVRYNKKGKMAGRADWRSIPLDTVDRVKVNGVIYKIKI